MYVCIYVYIYMSVDIHMHMCIYICINILPASPETETLGSLKAKRTQGRCTYEALMMEIC